MRDVCLYLCVCLKIYADTPLKKWHVSCMFSVFCGMRVVCSVLCCQSDAFWSTVKTELAWWVWCVRRVVFTMCVRCACVVRVKGVYVFVIMVVVWRSRCVFRGSLLVICNIVQHRFASALKVNPRFCALTIDRDLESALSKSINLPPPKTVNCVACDCVLCGVCVCVCVVCARCVSVCSGKRETLEKSGTCCSRPTLKLAKCVRSTMKDDP